MDKAIVAIAGTPVPTILIIAGIVFLLLSVAGDIGKRISVETKKQKLSGIIGGIMLTLGLAVYVAEGFVKYKNGILIEPDVSVATIPSKPVKAQVFSDSKPQSEETSIPTHPLGYYEGGRFVLTKMPVTTDNKLNIAQLPILKPGFTFDISKLSDNEKLIFYGRTSKTNHPILNQLLASNAINAPVSLVAIDCDKKPFRPVNFGEGSYGSKMDSANYHYKEFKQRKSFYNCGQAVKYRTLALCTFPDKNDPRNSKASDQLKSEFRACQKALQQEFL